MGDKIGNCKILGCPLFQGRPQYTRILAKDMYLLIEISHNILIICHGNHIKVKENNIMLGIDIHN